MPVKRLARMFKPICVLMVSRLPDDTESSSHHAEIVDRQGIPVLVDLGSTNGTYLNGTKIRKPEPLHDGDVIVVGSTEMRVYFE